MNTPDRADIFLSENGFAPSRSRAQAMIKAGLVYVNGNRVLKCSHIIDAEDNVEIKGEVCPYVSRGGLKLVKALEVFEIDPMDMICIDVGASTGGFTDVLLRRGAKLVYAVDVGTSQLADSLRLDPRVVVMEQVNARAITADMFSLIPTLAVMDVSFISILLILPALRSILGEKGRLVSLIKPQFEAGKQNIGKKGIVSDRKVHAAVLKDIIEKSAILGWNVDSITFSPITGSDGNIEFLASFSAADVPEIRITDAEIRETVKLAHEAAR